MPAYDRPIQFNLSQGSVAKPPRNFAATVSFASQDQDRINAYLSRMKEAGVITAFELGSYDARETTPTLYFP